MIEAITTVTTPAASFNLTTLLAVVSDLNITDADQTTRVFLERLIKQCSGAAASYCNRIFALQTYQDLIRLRGSADVLTLARFPVTQVVSINEDGSATALVQDTDFELDADTGRIYRLDAGSPAARIRWTASKIVVVYKAGYVLPGTASLTSTLPYDVEDAVIRMVKARHQARERDPVLKAETVDGVGSAEYWVSGSSEGNLTPDIAEILDGYRVPVAA